MRLSRVFVVVAAGAALVACSKFTITQPNATPTSYVPKQIWSGTSAAYRVAWTTADITAHATGSRAREVYSEIGRTVGDFHTQTRGQTSDCDMTRQADLQSVVGTIVSVRTADTMKCADGATGSGRGAMSIDLARPLRPLSLSSLFPAHELDALKVKAEHFCPSVPSDLLDRFAFSEYHPNAVVVAVTLPPGCSTAQVDITLKVPAGLKSPLGSAAQRKQGFLWHDQPAVSNGLSTTIFYHYRTAVQ